MQGADLAAVLAVQAACYPPSMQESDTVVAARLGCAPATCIVGCDANGVNAYLFAYPSLLGAVTDLDAPFAVAERPDTLYLHDLAVAPRAHGRGLARALIEHLLAQARRAGLAHAALVSVQDSAAFWQAAGFRQAAPRPHPPGAGLHTYPDGALYMTRPLSPPSGEFRMTQQVTIIATLHARPGQEAALAARMRTMIEATRQEQGCVLYDMHRAEDDPASFIMVEYWRDAAALELHFASSHMAALGADLPQLVDRPVEIRRFGPVA